jgi:aminopeptidase
VGGVETILEPDELRRYADAIVKASLGVGKGDFLFVQGHPEHREIVVATAAAGYRAGATTVDVSYYDPLVERAHYEHGSKDSLGVVSPWALRRMRELVKPEGARAVITGEVDHGYLDGIDPKRIAADSAGVAAQTKFYRRANLDLNARWTGAAWPTEYWASQVYPELAPLAGKRKLAQDFLWFCRLTDADGAGATGWLNHVKAIARRSAKLT